MSCKLNVDLDSSQSFKRLILKWYHNLSDAFGYGCSIQIICVSTEIKNKLESHPYAVHVKKR